MKRILSIVCLLLSLTALQAQPTTRGVRVLNSPDIAPDGAVTFRLWAPDAQEVLLTGDCVSQVSVTAGGEFHPAGEIPMIKGDDGIWTYATAPLKPEFYEYNFLVDGLRKLDPSNPVMSRNGATWNNNFIVSHDEGDKGWLYADNDLRHGNLSKVWYENHLLRKWCKLTVYTPADYNPIDPNRDWPVLYLLHGAGNDEDSWPDLGRASQILDNMIAAGKAEPMIVVMPDGDTGDDVSLEDCFQEIITFMESRYHVRTDKGGRAIAGLSRGGRHTFLTTLKMPDMFDYIGLFSAAVAVPGMDIRKDDLGTLLRRDPQVQEQVLALKEAHPALYWIGIGKDDYLYERNATLRAFYDESGFPYEYHESEGNHTWINWRTYLSEFLPRLFRTDRTETGRIAVFGGSFSVIPASDMAKNYWCKTLGVRVDTYGIGGAGFSAATGEDRYIPGQIRKALDSGIAYDTYILWCSTNDCAQGVSLTEQNRIIRECVASIRKEAPHAKILLFTSLPEPLIEHQESIPEDLPAPLRQMRRKVASIGSYAAAQEAVCRELGIPCLNLYTRSGIDLSNAPFFFGNDLLHMNDEGYDHIKELTGGFIKDNL